MDGDRAFRWTLLAVAAVLAFLLLYQYLTVILGAILLAYLLNFPYRRVAPIVGPRAAAVGLVVLTTVLVIIPLVLLATVAITGISDLAETIVGGNGLENMASFSDLLQQVYGAEFDFEQSIVEAVRNGQAFELARMLMEAIGGLSQAAISFTILLLLTFFLLVQGDELVAWVDDVLPLARSERRELFSQADDLMYAVVVGNVAIAFVDGTLVGIGLLITGFGSVLFWTFIAIFVALIPLVGSMIVWVPAAAYLVLTGEVLAGAFLFVYGGLFIGAVDNFLRPYFGAKQAGLNPAFFLVGVFTGLALIGVMGLFYGPIVLVMTKYVFDVLVRGEVEDGMEGGA